MEKVGSDRTWLLCTDGSDNSWLSIAHVASLSRAGDVVIIFSVQEERLFGIRLGIVDEERETEMRLHVSAAVHFLGMTSEATVRHTIETHADARTAICEKAIAEDVDYIVIGARGQSPMEAMLLGSVSQYVMLHAPCPVLVVRHDVPSTSESRNGDELRQRQRAAMAGGENVKHLSARERALHYVRRFKNLPSAAAGTGAASTQTPPS
eukprot:TRINITY_DN13301_c0_g1_i2.p1 TRINITY_DN13301_c0_g1~~TRINITY_DN13301_c0_g1_i2.p1  ORF type:complete len:208 (+),score=62.78 TRINITY_DN13301_c0_g1_i2:155-778(+)